MKNKIVIAGGSGSLGSSLIRKYYATETELVVLTRGEVFRDKNINYVFWDGKSKGAWMTELEGASAVINLTGKSVNCRYTEKNRKEIISSRIDSTKIIGEAIKDCKNPPGVWINAGSAAIFGNGGETVKTEGSSIGQGFSVEVCKAWEKEFTEAVTPATRKIFLRIGMVLQLDKGVLKPFMNMVKLGAGGKIGTGNQYLTWIHEDDFVNMIEWLIGEESLSGVLHCASPGPVTNREFMKTLRAALGMPFGLPTPSVFVKMGALLIGTEAELILTGRRVVSKVLEEHKFQFRFPVLEGALKDILAKK
jgi:uncharacterized protein (TIGR01777 family)